MDVLNNTISIWRVPIGTLEHWNIGILEYGNMGIWEHWNTGTWEYGIQSVWMSLHVRDDVQITRKVNGPKSLP